MPVLATDKLADLLVARGLLKQDQVRQAQRIAQSERRSMEQVLVQRKMVDETALYNLISDAIGIPFVDLSSYMLDNKILKLLSADIARKMRAIPLFKIGDTLSLAMADPTDVSRLDQLRHSTGGKIEPYLCSDTELSRALDQYYPSTGIQSLVDTMDEEAGYGGAEAGAKSAAQDLLIPGPGAEDAEEAQSANPIVKLLNLILEQAVRDGASDIHVEPDKDALRIRFRIDGILHEIPAPPRRVESALISRIKVLSDMDIAENRMAQDGRFRCRVEGKDIDLRVSVVPTINGENVVMRLLDTSGINIGLDNLGFSAHNLELFAKLIAKPYGMLLVTGPTGSGKTTTLYAALQRINSPDKHIMTIEDPVEYRIELVRQIQVNPKAGLDFANGLRSIVRQDPDVIMVGEIRDLPTAEMAVQSAMTGHLVFSTLHTNDAPGALTRLEDMGIEPFLISSSVIGVAAQRLVRRICAKCKESYAPGEKLLKALGLPADAKAKFYRGKGCRHCKSTGYRGRLAIAEIMLMDDAIRAMVIAKQSAGDIRKAAEAAGMISLKADGLQKVLEGVTTVEEISRVTELLAEAP